MMYAVLVSVVQCILRLFHNVAVNVISTVLIKFCDVTRLNRYNIIVSYF